MPSTAILFLAVVSLAVGGCSRVSTAYYSADVLIEKYVLDYLALEDAQLSSWKPRLADTLARHRHEDLPYLARFLDEAREGAVKGFDRQRTSCLLDQFEDLYRRHMRIAVDLATPLLARLTPDQIHGLADKFREEKAEDEADLEPASTARRNHKRAKRYGKSIAWWIGPMTERQIGIVREQTAAMPDTAADWVAYRDTERKVLIDLLQRRAGEKEIRSFLTAWLVEHRELPARLRQAREQIRERISKLLIGLDATFSAGQRTHFADRLADLRDEFMSPQEHPHMAPVSCAGSE